MTLVKTNMHFRVVPRQICRCNGCIYGSYKTFDFVTRRLQMVCHEVDWAYVNVIKWFNS